MAVAFVGATSGDSGAGAAFLRVDRTPTVGNYVVIAVFCSGMVYQAGYAAQLAPPTVSDNASPGNAYIYIGQSFDGGPGGWVNIGGRLIQTAGKAGTNYVCLYVGKIVNATTHFVVTQAGAPVALDMVVAEYSGVNTWSVGGFLGTKDPHSGIVAAVSSVAPAAASMIVGGFCVFTGPNASASGVIHQGSVIRNQIANSVDKRIQLLICDVPANVPGNYTNTETLNVASNTFSAVAVVLTAQQTHSLSWTARAALQATRTLSWTARALLYGGKGSRELGWQSRAYFARYATDRFRKIGADFRMMLEVDWPSGNARYGDSHFAVGDTGFDGRILSIDQVDLGCMGDLPSDAQASKDTILVTLSNLDLSASIESLWSDSQPPEGSPLRLYYYFKGDSLDRRVQVFAGVVEKIEGLADDQLQISVFSVEEKNDILLGVEINPTNWPGAPTDALGKMEPIVFGTVPQFQGIVVQQVGKTKLAAITLKTDPTVPIEDTLNWAASGTAMIGDEEFTYPVIDQVNQTLGTNAQPCQNRKLDYNEGSTVVEKIALVVLLAGHPITSVGIVWGMVGSRFAKLDPSLYSVDLGTISGKARLTFPNGWPQLPAPAGGTSVAHIQMDSLGAQNSAQNALNAAGASPNWSEKIPAVISASQPLLSLKCTQILQGIGDIHRVWVMVEFDDSPWTTPSSGQVPSPVLSGTQGDVVLVSIEGQPILTPNQLYKGGNLPTLITAQIGLGTTRAYDDSNSLVDNGHSHGLNSSGQQTLPCTQTPTPDPSAAPPVNGVTIRKALQPTVASVTALQANSIGPVVTAKFTGIDCLTSSFMGLKVVKRGVAQVATWLIKGYRKSTHLPVNTTTLPTFALGGSYLSDFQTKNPNTGVEDGYVLATLSGSFTSWGDFSATNTWCESNDGDQPIGPGSFTAVTFSINVTGSTTTMSNPTGVLLASEAPLTHTVALLSDITSLVAADWTFFTNKTVDVTYKSVGFSTTIVKIKRVSFLVEHGPYTNQPCDKILADVVGIGAGANGGALPTDVLIGVLTNPVLLGLPSSSYNAADFAKAAAIYLAAGYRMDFALTAKVKTASLISSIVQESRALVFWENGSLAISYDPLAGGMSPPFLTFRKQDMDQAGGNPVQRTRYSTQDLIHDYTALYCFDYRFGKPIKVVAGAFVSTIGWTIPLQETLQFIRDDVTAGLLTAYRVDHRGKPRFVVKLSLTLCALEIRRGWIVAVQTERHSMVALQVAGISYQVGMILLTCISWDSYPPSF